MEEESDPSTTNITAKRKRSLPSKFLTSPTLSKIAKDYNADNDLQHHHNSGKRPRGRPPLAIAPSNVIISKKGVFNHGGVKMPLPSLSSNMNNSISSSGGLASGVDDNAKPSKQPPAQITARIIALMMTQVCVSISDLSKIMPETQKETIMAVMEVLQVSGIVTTVKANSDTTSSAGGLFSTIYSLTGFAKASESIDIRRLPEALIEKQQSGARIRERIKILQELSDSNMSKNEFQESLQSTIERFTDNDPSLEEDVLYKDLRMFSPPENY